MQRASLPHFVAVLGLAMTLSACGSGSEPPADPGATSGVPSPTTPSDPATTISPTGQPTTAKATDVTVIGTLEEGVEAGCFVLKDEQTGEEYSVSDKDVPELGPGTRVRIEGTVDPDLMSYCQQGQVLIVHEVTDPDVTQ